MSTVIDITLSAMDIARSHFGRGWARVWRRLVGVVVIYAVVLQSVFLGFAGIAASASTDEGLPAFELCLNGHQGGPLSPADLPGHHGNTHCIFCFTGTHHASGPPPPFSFQRINLELGNAWWTVDDWRLSDFYEYSRSQPRGPPLDARCNDVAGLDGDVRAGADRDAEVRLDQGGASLMPSPTKATRLPFC
jgi:hypothetical protein